jgi:hypothetical protein
MAAAFIILWLLSLPSLGAVKTSVSADARAALTWLYRVDASAEAIGQKAREMGIELVARAEFVPSAPPQALMPSLSLFVRLNVYRHLHGIATKNSERRQGL